MSGATCVGHFQLAAITTTGLCDYSVGNGLANWATASAIATIEAAARHEVATGHGRVALGDASREHGGIISGHDTHRRGLDVDVRLLRKDKAQCRGGTTYRQAAYDRAATRALIQTIRGLAPGHVKLIYFNDPVLIKEGLTQRFHGPRRSSPRPLLRAVAGGPALPLLTSGRGDEAA